MKADEPCDFCGEKPVRWLYRCLPFEITFPRSYIRHRDSGTWVACNICSGLIRKHQWDTLAIRCLNHIPGLSGPRVDEADRLEVLAFLKRYHQMFKRNLRGDPAQL